MSEFGLILMGIGLFFDFFGCVGLVRLPDVYTRLQAATKCVTLGTCLILVGVFFRMGVGPAGIKALVCAVFVLISSPTAAHAIARGAYKAGVKLADGFVVDRYADAQTKGSDKE